MSSLDLDLPLEAEHAPWPDGEVVSVPLPDGVGISIRFPSPFEAFIKSGDRRLCEDDGPEDRAVLIWVARRLPALFRALDVRFELRARWSDKTAWAHDLVDLHEHNALVDHGTLRERLGTARIQIAPFSLLGTSTSKADIVHRLRALYAAGTIVEVRVEDDGRVVSRRRMQVGR